MDIIKIHELPEGTELLDSHELPVSTSSGAGGVKRYSLAIFKAWVIGFVTPLISAIAQGPQGPAGAPGAQGAQGAAGAAGLQGPVGPQGLKGNTGSAGPVGIQGPIGERGEKGETGAQGGQGIQGPAGADGAQGPPGADGGNFDMVTYIQNAPICADEAEATVLNLSNYTLYKTATGELRYKLPASNSRFTNQFTNQFS
ncbi:hypothetical protein [Mucilaginibacter sp. 5C4]|uniref:hypothetical protein n=1 Tax=Mucilaginibacter sp. 5C4 TaxID=3048589 RepID=UPI002AC94194|nr:hypothetical protein [Mucilaginibacter sp. 5C4]MEB0302394.1 hypothetical protein [Mucilaginibacter sp. 5C4]WPX22960.1 hypothetical protein RHM67_16895 [Mucilaginibacter sp. 5C4]